MIAPPGTGFLEVYNSVGGAAFFQRLVEEWCGAGECVRTIQAMDEREYRRPRGILGRLGLRWQMYPGYGLRCWRLARWGRAARPVRVVTTNPFFAPALVQRATRGSGATINLLYDLFPEALIQAGQVSADSPVARMCAAITRRALRECQATVFLGERLRTYAETKYGAARRAVVIPVGADGTPFLHHAPAPLPVGARPRVLYSGLMGRMHDVDTVARALALPVAEGAAWVFHASGAGYSRLKAGPALRQRATWGGSLPGREWENEMKAAQVALVTIAPGAERVVMPSKTYSALVAGQAVLAVCPRDSDLAELVDRHNCGWVVAPGDVDALGRVLREMAEHREELLAKRRRAFEAGHRLYEAGVVARQWLALFAELRKESVRK